MDRLAEDRILLSYYWEILWQGNVINELSVIESDIPMEKSIDYKIIDSDIISQY
jgi:hypothetical protein